MLLALLWSCWHLPLFLYPAWITVPFWIYVLIMVGVTFLLTYGTNLARFAVITPIVMHAVFNTTSRFLNGLFTGTAGPRTQLPFDVVLALCGLATAAVLVLATRGQLGYRGSRDIRGISEDGLQVCSTDPPRCHSRPHDGSNK